MSEQPQAESERMSVSFSVLHHPDHFHGRRGSFQGWRPVFPSECIILLVHNSSFTQTLGSMVGSLEGGEVHEEAIYHD